MNAKGLFTLVMFTAPALAGLTSCSNDDDLPNVTVSVDYAGAVGNPDTGHLYIVAGNSLDIDAFTATPALDGGKKVTVGAVAYYWNYQLLGTVIAPPFAFAIDTKGLEPGDYMLQLQATVYQVDCSVGLVYVAMPVTVVATEADLPADLPADASYTPVATDIRSGVSPTV